MDNETTVKSLKDAIEEFVEERDWKQFHNPQDLAVSLSIEVAELLEIFQWEIQKEMSPDKLDHLKEELADIIIYSLSLANAVDLDVSTIVLDKIKANGEKYPIEKVRGSSKKYAEHNNDSL